MHSDATDELGLVKFLYLAFGKPNDKTPPTSFDAAVSSWVLMACPHSQGYCTW
jgi:hypothetical protein